MNLKKLFDKHFQRIFSSAFQWCRQFFRNFPFSPSKTFAFYFVTRYLCATYPLSFAYPENRAQFLARWSRAEFIRRPARNLTYSYIQSRIVTPASSLSTSAWGSPRFHAVSGRRRPPLFLAHSLYAARRRGGSRTNLLRPSLLGRGPPLAATIRESQSRKFTPCPPLHVAQKPCSYLDIARPLSLTSWGCCPWPAPASHLQLLTLGLSVASSTSLALKAFFLVFLPRRRTCSRLISRAAQRRMRPAGAVRAASTGPALLRARNAVGITDRALITILAANCLLH